MIKRNCLYCGKEKEYYPSQIKNSGGKFCSRRCKGKYEGGGRRGEYNEERTARIQEVKRANLQAKYPTLYNKDYLILRYYEQDFSLKELADDIGCSLQAVKTALNYFGLPIKSIKEVKSSDRYLDKYRGENNWWWSGGTVEYRGKDWNRQKRKARERDNHTCQRCGKTKEQVGKNLDVHHIIPYILSEDNSLENLVTLCPSCHKITEWEWRKENPELYQKCIERRKELEQLSFGENSDSDGSQRGKGREEA